MATELRKTVKRKTANAHDYRGKRLVVTLYPGDTIGFREERCRKEFQAPLSKVYRQVVKWNVDAEKTKKKRKPKRGVL